MNWSAILDAVRWVLGGGLVIANFVVWYGVYLERDSAPPEEQHRGWRILVRGLAVETALGFLIWANDGALGIIQANAIATAQTTAAMAVLEAGKLGARVKTLPVFVAKKEKQFDAQFSDLRIFANSEKVDTDRVIADLKAKQEELAKARTDALSAAKNAKADLDKINSALARYQKDRAAIASVVTSRELDVAQQNKVATDMTRWAKLPSGGAVQSVSVFSPSGSYESSRLVDEIADALTKAHFNVNRYPVTMGHPMTLSGIGMYTSSNSRGVAVANALVKALKNEGLTQAFVIPDHWQGCETPEMAKAMPGHDFAADPFCSSFSVEVGDIPLLPKQ